MDTPNLSTLPLDKCHFNLIGEGAANLVFEVVPDPQVVIDEKVKSIIHGNLLRVPKAGTKAHTHPELQQYWETTISPHFNPSNLVQQRLVKLGGPTVISRLNSALHQEFETRRHDFKGTRVADVEYGMLVEDMRAKSPASILALEFKPKWLAQSPNAPTKAVRCRTCAREALRSHKKGKPKVTPCPLDFIVCNGSNSNISSSFSSTLDGSPPTKAAVTFTSEQKKQSISSILTSILAPSPLATSLSPDPRLVSWIQTNTLLPSLRQAQLDNDTTGPLDPKSKPEQLALAMTLRDCSVYLRVPTDPNAKVEAKLGDLDKKDVGQKLEYWREMETELIQGGYYEGTEKPRQKTNCVIERLGQ
ncbi:hypothetical protein QBC42DRAFT_275390 [Cladorrhinum samala]|uniref:Inositol-pentakisphosphate 2-kinase n=1 Tax=Cladorrhinum samala TaxID=585594 RepID=A0AAV9HDV4_9PEZI|nr:hypothetical protein QBC42DRAFT_275390 [Cladorrhinum samala]